ncbi:MAG: carbamoyltransferase [Candidatus Handelsmanbacteria bacterium]|nr:carbamoyltransferase [Candidatus Handelsmanbacteria bacterium]
MGVYLGIFDGHNAAAAMCVSGRVLHVLQEERLTGVKNFFGPPALAAARVLELAGLPASAVDRVCLASRYLATPRHPHAVKEGFDQRYNGGLRQGTAGLLASNSAYRQWRTEQRMQERREVAASWGFSPERVEFFDHHQAHAATAYYGLRRDEGPYLVLTLDGGGDGLSGSVWRGEGGRLERLALTPQADSLGEIYAVTTHLLGFMPLEHEYKLMGMAPYASQERAARVAQVFRGYLDLDPNHPLAFRRQVPEALSRLGPRLQRDLERLRFDEICAGLQLFTEELMARWVRACAAQTGIGRVLAAGGVFMNVKANKIISELGEVACFEAFPSCGDESLPLGAGYLAAAQAGETPQPLEHGYLGNDLSAAECRQALRAVEGVEVEEPADLAGRVAGLLAGGEVVARASGPMEFGARALGNRSILADPINQDVVRVINRMIKKRDFWMPFAPVVRRREAGTYFHNPKGLPSPYMMNTFDSTEKRSEFMAAVHNADLSARPQLLEAGQNPPYEAIIDAFAARTGRQVLLNTSFNLHGFPIACSAADALGVLVASGLNRLVLGPFLVSKLGCAQ